MKLFQPQTAEVRHVEDLNALARRINAAHEAGHIATRKGLEHYRAAGEALLAARSQCKHGTWLSWLGSNCPGVSERTARRYMEWAKSDVTSDLPVEDQVAEWQRISGNAPAREEQEPVVPAVEEVEPDATVEESPEPVQTATRTIPVPEIPEPQRIIPVVVSAPVKPPEVIVAQVVTASPKKDQQLPTPVKLPEVTVETPVAAPEPASTVQREEPDYAAMLLHVITHAEKDTLATASGKLQEVAKGGPEAKEAMVLHIGRLICFLDDLGGKLVKQVEADRKQRASR